MPFGAPLAYIRRALSDFSFMKGNFMEENQIQDGLESSDVQIEEPTLVDNSLNEKEDTVIEENLIQEEGESIELEESLDPSDDLILGKFKSVDELIKAYQELQKHQGHSSEELGSLRKEMANLNGFKKQMDLYNSMQKEYFDVIQRDKEKYLSKGYFEEPTFKEIYKEVLGVFGANLDTDRMIELLDNYVQTRIQANEKRKVAEKETQKALDSMTYADGSKATFTPPKKRFDEMTEKEIDELLDRLI